MSQQQLPAVQTVALLNAPNQDLVIETQFKLPPIGENDVLVRNLYAGVNPLDVAFRRTGMYISSYPAILGVDCKL